jgi:putative endonuclease
MHFLYLIQSKNDLTFYIGTTDNLKRRLDEHNKGLSLATKAKRPWILIYCEIYRSKKDALLREKKLKEHKSGWLRLKERIANSVLLEQN